MAHTTTCPACGTTFRITAEQLLVRNGSVRCGHCAQVFNAHESLTLDYPPPPAEETPLAEEPAAMVEPVAEFGAELEQPPEAEPPLAEADSDAVSAIAEVVSELEPVAEPEPELEPAPIPEYAPEPAPEAEPVPDPPPADEPPPELPAPAEPAPHLEPEPGPQPDASPEPVTPPEPPALAASLALKRNPRRLWAGGALLLLLGLVAQDALHFRTELIALSPALKPAFEQACRVLGCRVALPRNADLLSIEASSLEADPAHAGIVALNAVLRNRADYLQALPLFELTLTDYQDALVARRVFQSQEYLPPGATALAGMPANEEIEVKLNIDLGDAKAAGYRVYLFYPSTAS